MSLETEDRAESVARQETHKRGKRIFILFLISFTLYSSAELINWLFDLRSSVKVVSPVIGLLGVFICGEVFSLPEIWVNEFRTRIREIDDKLIELKATLNEFKR